MLWYFNCDFNFEINLLWFDIVLFQWMLVIERRVLQRHHITKNWVVHQFWTKKNAVRLGKFERQRAKMRFEFYLTLKLIGLLDMENIISQIYMSWTSSWSRWLPISWTIVPSWWKNHGPIFTKKMPWRVHMWTLERWKVCWFCVWPLFLIVKNNIQLFLRFFTAHSNFHVMVLIRKMPTHMSPKIF